MTALHSVSSLSRGPTAPAQTSRFYPNQPMQSVGDRRNHTAVHGHEPCAPTANGCCSSCFQRSFAEARLPNLRLEEQQLRPYLLYLSGQLTIFAAPLLAQRFASEGAEVEGYWFGSFQFNLRALRQRIRGRFRFLERATFRVSRHAIPSHAHTM